jgi:glutamate---cysteine ligase / carboxylate-amine ligase
MSAPLHWFTGFGIELEYMIVDRDSLAVRPIADQVLSRLAQLALGGAQQPGQGQAGVGQLPAQGPDEVGPPMEVELGPVAWSNELALHVIELKTNGPVPELEQVPDLFQAAVASMNQLLAAWDARLMPTAMHPLMRPSEEFRLWPRDDEGIYATFDRIFDCRGHGWSNLQSMHVNLPFANVAEFAPLHAAVRLLLPLLPALAASSPLVEGQWAANLDERMHTYRGNARRVPSVSGWVVPESVTTRAAYERDVLGKIYQDLSAHDPEGILRYEWVNARGAIARFDRMAVEIRVLDAQECPRADLALAWLVTELLRARAQSGEFLKHDALWSPERLAGILLATVQAAEGARISDTEFLRLWGISSHFPMTAAEVWRELAAQVPGERRPAQIWPDVEFFLLHGSLASRLRRRLGASNAANRTSPAPSAEALRATYAELCSCLESGERFLA